MLNVATLVQEPLRWRWPVWFVWLLCGITLLNLALFSRVTDPYAPMTFSVCLLNPPVTIGAAWLSATTLRYHHPHYR